MSLLMDALKKAEQEKREAAKKLVPAEDELSVTRKETIAEITDAHPVGAGMPANQAAELTESAPENPAANTTYHTMSLDLALEPLESTNQNPLLPKRPPVILSVEDRAALADPDATQNVLGEKLNLASGFEPPATEIVANTGQTQQVGIEQTRTTLQADPDHTFHGVSLDQPVVAGLYEDTIQGEPFKPGEINRSYDETLPGVPAAQLARDIGTQDQPTPVAAQTLFTATGTITKPSHGFRWLLISLAVLAVGSATVFYYYSVTPVSRNIPSPLVAKGVETIISSQNLQAISNAAVPAPVETPVPVVTDTGAASVPPQTSTTAPGQTVADAGAVDSGTLIAPPEAIAVTEPPVETTVSAAVPEPVTQTAALPEVIEPPASLVRISRTSGTSEDAELLTGAFTAWQQGDYELARTKYQQAHTQSPDNRDVLLGLAAVATKTGDTIGALQIYMRLVSLNPLDSVARAALISLQPGEDVSASISAVKSMLADSPEQPSLYFTLGKLYATQANWSGAQQAFFDAYRLDSANPDYAFNLAVCLDRLNQTGSALDYYTVALGLAETAPAGFDRATITDRIQTLEGGE